MVLNDRSLEGMSLLIEGGGWQVVCEVSPMEVASSIGASRKICCYFGVT